MKKVVTRTYYNKKLGEFVTKTYEYEYSKAKISPLLVDKNGKVYENRVKEFTKDMDVYDKAEVEQYIKFYSQHKKRVRMRTIQSKMADSAIEKMIINTGRSAGELASEIGVDEADLLDEMNWDGSNFVFNGAVYSFEFKYTGALFTRV